MGAKSPAKLKLRRPTYKCDICHRKLLSAQTLKTHMNCIHKIAASNSEQRAKSAKPKTKKAPIVKPKAKPTPTNAAEGETNELKTQNVSDVRKIEFECPVCNVTYSSYYPAYRHIQKSHCVNSRGQKVESTSVDLIKPLRVEMCIKCNKRIRANDLHCCWEAPLLDQSGLSVQYHCTGCKQRFSSMQLFDMHVSGLHSDGVESMFFPTMSDFLTWKQQMQTKTNVDYLILGKCNSKQTYRCTYIPPNETTAHNNVSNICPASIVVQEFTKGIQVHFYKKHHGHECPDYVCPEKYKKFLITSLMTGKNPQSYDVEYDEKDLYCQFKVLLESIIIEAAKVKIDDLKLLLEKALEMTSILNNYDEDDDTYTYPNKSLCEEQISKALDSIKGLQMKRKATDEVTVDPKKRKEVTPKIVNAFSMASQKTERKKEIKVEQKKEVENKVEDTKKEEAPSPRILRNTQVQSSPSFNDSYKDFVDKNFLTKPLTAENCKPTRTSTLGRQPVRRASPVSQPQRGLRVRPLSKLVEPSEIEEELAKDFIEVTVPALVKDVPSQTKQTDKPNIGPEITIKKVLPNENKESDSTENAKQHTKEVKVPIRKENAPRTKPRKQVMKTKIGQFKPSLSPKSTSPKKPEFNRSFSRIKPDIEYEVKEQENDCNILILKI